MKRLLLFLISIFYIGIVVAQVTSVPSKLRIGKGHKITIRLTNTATNNGYFRVDQEGLGKVAFANSRGEFTESSYSQNLNKGTSVCSFDVYPIYEGSLRLIVSYDDYAGTKYESAYSTEAYMLNDLKIEGPSTLEAGYVGSYSVGYHDYNSQAKKRWVNTNGHFSISGEQVINDVYRCTIKALPYASGTHDLKLEYYLTNKKWGDIVVAESRVKINVPNPLSNIQLEGTSEEALIGKEIKYTVKGYPSGSTITWSFSKNNSPVKIISGQGTNTVTIRSDVGVSDEISVKVAYGKAEGYLYKKIAFKTLEELVDLNNLQLEVPETAALGETFTCKVKGFENLKKIIPDAKLEWVIESRNDAYGKINALIKISSNEDLGEIRYKVVETAILDIRIKVIVDNKVVTFYNYPWRQMINLGDPFFAQMLTGDDGSCFVFLFNIPENVKKITENSFSKVNEEYDTYGFKGGGLARFGLDMYLLCLEETAPTTKARVKVKFEYNDGRIEYLVSDILSFREEKSRMNTFATPMESPKITQPEIYSVKVYSFPLGNIVHQEKDVESFNINNTNLQSGIYIIEKVDSKGIRTSKKVSKQE